MKNKQFTILSLILLCFMLFQLNVPPVEATIPYIEMDFDTEVVEGAIHVGTNFPSHNMRIWRWSGGYWGNDYFRIEADEMDMLADNSLSADALDVTYTIREDLPSGVINFLNSGGSWEDIEIAFSMKRDDIAWYQIFREKPQWKVNGNQIESIIKPKFIVDPTKRLYDHPQMLELPQIHEPYGQQVYSVFTPSGGHLGASWDIEYEDIISHHGELNPDKAYQHVEWNGGYDGVKDGSNINIGHGTFSNGGAIAYEFWFEIQADFYVKQEGGIGAGKSNNLSIVNLEGDNTLVAGGAYDLVAHIENHTGEVQEDVPIELWVDNKLVYEDEIDIQIDGKAVDLYYTVPNDYIEELLPIEVKLNMKTPRGLQETTYEDNQLTTTKEVTKGNDLDLEVTHITHSRFFKGKYGTVNIHVRNNSDKTINNPPVPIRMKIAGTTAEFHEEINLSPRGETAVNFRLKVPDEERDFTIIGEINHTRVYEENNYNNNSKSKNTSIIEGAAPSSCHVDTTTWVEYRSKNQYITGTKIKSHYEDYISHYEYEYIYIGDDEQGNPIYKRERNPVWRERLVGFDVRFNAQLHTSMKVTPSKIKTGYGFQAEVETWVTTNYDKENKLSNAQSIYVYVPDRSTPIKMVTFDNTSTLTKIKWRLPVNHESVLPNQRKHYIPIDWPDGDYNVKAVANNASTPNEPLCNEVNANIAIKGTMYEDDHTGIR